MRSIAFVLTGAIALVVVGCGSSVEKMFSDTPGAGGAGGSGATGGDGSTGEGAGTSTGDTTTSAGTGAGSGAGAGSGSGAGAGTGSGAAGSGGSTTSSGSGASGGSGSSGQSTSVGVGSAVASSGSGGGYCTHDACEVGEPLDFYCSDCTMKICQQDPSCCDSWWHDGCAYLASEQCGCAPMACASCSEFVNGSPEPLCPWSAPLADQLLSCVCGYGCPSECGEACMGNEASDECQSCVVSSCAYEIDACINDF